MEQSTFSFECDGTQHQGYVAHPGGDSLPTVMVAHDWSGLNDFAKEAAKKMAQRGYLGCAVDLFGEGKTGSTKEEKMGLIEPLMKDRGQLQKRLLAALEKVNTLKGANPQKVAALGFCFGGLCVLDLARSGAELKGVLSFHGLLDPSGLPTQTIKASVLALHGHDDPMVPPDKVLAFETEMTDARADWQLHAYGNTVHAFTNPQANDTELGTIYNEQTAARAWKLGYQFLEEIFS